MAPDDVQRRASLNADLPAREAMSSQRIELEVEVANDEGTTLFYRYRCDWEQAPPMEQVEAHVASVLKLLDATAHEADEDTETA
jgi:hypothetical protein